VSFVRFYYFVFRVNCFDLFFERALYYYSRLSWPTSVFVFHRRVEWSPPSPCDRSSFLVTYTYAWICRSRVLIITIEWAIILNGHLPLTVPDGKFVRTVSDIDMILVYTFDIDFTTVAILFIELIRIFNRSTGILSRLRKRFQAPVIFETNAVRWRMCRFVSTNRSVRYWKRTVRTPQSEFHWPHVQFDDFGRTFPTRLGE